jgi:hypothetical protein
MQLPGQYATLFRANERIVGLRMVLGCTCDSPGDVCLLAPTAELDWLFYQAVDHPVICCTSDSCKWHAL